MAAVEQRRIVQNGIDNRVAAWYIIGANKGRRILQKFVPYAKSEPAYR